jgi:hypothetical protein
MASVLVPATAVLNTPLRARFTADALDAASPQPCTDLLHGQIEDYGIVVVEDISTNTSDAPRPAFTLIPNPSSGDVWLVPVYDAKGTAVVEIHNEVGQVIGQTYRLVGDGPLLLNMREAANGVYTVRCTWNDHMWMMRLVISR